MHTNFYDSQNINIADALAFTVEQLSEIETTIYNKVYPDIQYSEVLPVVTNGWEWQKSITVFSMDHAGAAKWFNPGATDMPLAEVALTKGEQRVEMSGLGYLLNFEELAQAARAGINIEDAKAEACFRGSEEFNEVLAFVGDSTAGFTGLANNSAVTAVNAPNDGTGSSRYWKDKSAELILRDINMLLGGSWTVSMHTELMDTLLIPSDAGEVLATRRIGTDSETTVWEWIAKNNLYTRKTGQALTIREIVGTETLGPSSTGRVVAYRNDEGVVRFHLPMPFRFFPPVPAGPMRFYVPGGQRTGGTEIRRPKAVRYLDQVTPTPA